MDKLKTPPLILTSLFIYFDPNLKILDNKSVFYDEIKHQFSQFYHPEIKNLKYNMGDIDYFDPDRKKVITINTSCFKLGGFSYEKIDTFLGIFRENLVKFSKIYNTQTFNSFYFIYENIVIINKVIGLNFNDYFTVGFDVKSKKPKEFLAGEGTCVYKVKDGLLAVIIKPELNAKNETEKFRYNIEFTSNRTKMDLDKLIQAIKEAHIYIEDVFESSLTNKYLDTLK